MIYNKTNIMEELKFKRKIRTYIFYFSIFLTWILAYILILKVEASTSNAYGFFALGIMFAIITIVSIFLVPAHREGSLRLFKFGMIGYSAYTIGFLIVLWATMQGDGGTTQSALYNFSFYGRILIPVGLCVWQGKEIFLFFKGKRTKNEEIENLRNHGNDGMH